MMTEDIIRAFNAKKNGVGWKANCPAHGDKNASLHIDTGENGNTVIKCFAGCCFEDIAAAAGLKPGDFFGDDTARPERRIVAEYSYLDAFGVELFQVVRYEPKDFRQRTREGTGWKWSLKGVQRVLYRLPQVIEAGRAGRLVFVVEGEKDVAALESLGLVATCNAGGAGKWEPQYTEALRGAKVVVLPDQDAPGRKHGALVGGALHGIAEWVKVIDLPQKDAAEWVAQGGGREQLRELIKAGQRFDPALAPEPALDFGDKRRVTSSENGRKGGRPAAPPHAETADRYANEVLRKGGLLTMRHWRGQWYTFGADGWTDTADSEIQGLLVTYLRADPDLRPFATSHYAASVMLNMRAHDLCGLSAEVEMPCWLDSVKPAHNWVAFKNGVVVNIWEYAQAMAEGRKPVDYKRPLDSNFFSTDFVGYDWDTTQVPELFLDYMRRVQPDLDGNQAVKRMMGLLVADVTRYEVFFQLYGHGSNGKTVLLDIIKALVGQGNVSAVTLDGIIGRFQSWPLARAKVNICGELPTDVGRGQFHAIEGALKDAVSGGMIEIERKGADKYLGRCRARFVMSTNTLPTFFDRSDGIWRRLRVVPFGVQIPEDEKDVMLSEKIIKSDMPGILIWVLEGLAETIKAGFFADSEAGRLAKDSHRMDCDHERQFLTENYEQGESYDRIKATDIYEGYKDFCAVSGYRALGASKFYQRIPHVFPRSAYNIAKADGLAARVFDYLKEASQK